MSNYKIRVVSLHLGMSGNNIEFEPLELFGLKVGEKVTQVGDGRNSGSIATDFFTEPFTYRGSLMVQFDELERMYAFEAPEKTPDGENIYFLYGATEDFIYSEVAASRTLKRVFLYTYMPEFVKAE